MFLTALLLAASAAPTPSLGALAAPSSAPEARAPLADAPLAPKEKAQDPSPENSPSAKDDEATPADLPDGVVARLGDVDITLADYKDELFKIYGYGALNEFLHRRLLATEAARLKIQVTEAELAKGWDQEWTAMVARSRGSEKDVIQNLKALGYTAAQYKDQFLVGMHAKLLENRIIQTLRVPTEVQLRARFDLDYGLNGERVVLRHLVLNRSRTKAAMRAVGTAPELMTIEHIDKEIERKAAELFTQAQGDVDFEELCRQSSHDLSVAQNGGVIPNYNFLHYGEEIAAATHAAPVGKVVGPIKLSAGTHLLKVESRVVTDFAKVRSVLNATLMAMEPSHAERAGLKARLAAETKIERR